MNQWEVWTWKFPHGTHPAVILTSPAWLHLPDINILACTSQEARAPDAHEVLLDQADGLNWPTLCRCHRIWSAPRAELIQRRGVLTRERRRQVGDKLIRVFGLYLD